MYIKFYKILFFIIFLFSSLHANLTFKDYCNKAFSFLFIDGIQLFDEYRGKERKEGNCYFKIEDDSVARCIKKHIENDPHNTDDINFTELRLPFYKRNNRMHGVWSTAYPDSYLILTNWISHRLMPGDVLIVAALCTTGFGIYKKWYQ